MYLVAHRGLHSKNTKENTLGAIKLGDSNSRIDGVEIDVRLTKDNQVVVIHDESIDRVSNGKGKVSEMSLDRLKRFNYGSFLKRTTISTLDEVLNKFSTKTLLIIELKDELIRNIILAKKVLEITSRYPNLNIWFKSFSKDIVIYLKENTNRPVGALVNKNHIDNLDLDVDFYSISKKIITNEMVSSKLLQNKNIMVWTINSKDDMEALNNSVGTNLENIYIISDNPLIFKK
ncbi:MAG: hypothetical protein IJO43_02015 [Bacilli bacterium]|nr:hypothetical protein [Bacilli bacterium]